MDMASSWIIWPSETNSGDGNGHKQRWTAQSVKPRPPAYPSLRHVIAAPVSGQATHRTFVHSRWVEYVKPSMVQVVCAANKTDETTETIS